MSKRSYDQPDCGLAVALDLLGERWTLLIVRELLLGPQRYTDLSAALEGLSSNLLAGRLRHLEDCGVVQRADLPPPAACTVYELTPVGADLEPLVVQLAQWGARFTNCSAISEPRAAAFAMVAQQPQQRRANPAGGATEATAGPSTGPCRIDIDEFSIAVQLESGRLLARPHPPGNPVAIARTSGVVYQQMISGELAWSEAVASHRVQVEGDLDQLQELFHHLR